MRSSAEPRPQPPLPSIKRAHSIPLAPLRSSWTQFPTRWRSSERKASAAIPPRTRALSRWPSTTTTVTTITTIISIGITITTITTITITTTREERPDGLSRTGVAACGLASLLGSFARSAQNVSVGTVKDRMGRRRPLRMRRERAAALINPPRLQFPLRRFLFRHRNKFEIGLLRHDQDLCERLPCAKNVGAALRRRFEDQEKYHGPPSPDQRWNGDRRGVGQIGVESRMGLHANGESFVRSSETWQV